MPVFPGQLRYIRRNLFHAIYVLDPASICGLEVMLVTFILRRRGIFESYAYEWVISGYVTSLTVQMGKKYVSKEIDQMD